MIRSASILYVWLFIGLPIGVAGDESGTRVVARRKAAEAIQAVAVDEDHFYAIGNSIIGKYDKQTGEQVSVWKADDELPLHHLNSGVVIDQRLYCSNSNYPEFPETSSVEIFDTTTLDHVASHSFGIYEGSLTWVDRHDGYWWAVFAHYSKKADSNPFAKPHTYTSLIKFDGEWRRLASWVFPPDVLDRFAPYSCSGGGWGPDNQLYCTGHDRGELYQLQLPRAGSTLRLVRTIPVDITGQGISWDPDHRGTLYGIDRPRREVIVTEVLQLNVEDR